MKLSLTKAFFSIFLTISIMHIFAVKSHAVNSDSDGVEKTLSAPCYKCRVLSQIRHDSRAFTEGLFIHDGLLYEPTGRHGSSSLRCSSLKSGETIRSRRIEKKYFGEGSCIYGNKIFVLTWTQKTCLIFSSFDFKLLRKIKYTGQGWGLTSDGKNLIQSNGSDILTFRDPESFAKLHTIAVRDGSSAVKELNELEYVDGLILANIWRKDLIAAISPESGRVQFWIDISALRPAAGESAEVANGIAWDSENKKLYVTGKLWNRIFEIKWPIESEGQN
jgi:glutamine cyclotransferase